MGLLPTSSAAIDHHGTFNGGWHVYVGQIDNAKQVDLPSSSLPKVAALGNTYSMPPIVWPDVQQFAHPSEMKAFEAIRDSLGEEDAILTNLKLTDPQYGDIEIDLVVLIKDRGCMVVEIKGGHISFDGTNWVQSDRQGSRAIYPHAQAIKNMYSLRNFLRNRWSQGNLRTDWVACFPESVVPDVHSPDLPKSMIIDKDELVHGVSKMRTILSEQSRQALPRIPNWVELAVKAFKPLSILEASVEAVLENNYEYVRDLTHQREWILDLIAENPRIFVRGPAGSGKTWLACEQAKRWSRQGMRVGLVTFNRGLVTYLKNKANELPESERPAWVGTFHEFAMYLGTSAGSPADYAEPVDRFEPQLIAAVEKMHESEKFDAWVVDEAQDFLTPWWRVLELSLKKPGIGQMALFGDDKQMVYLNRGKPKGFFAYLRLTENIRNSKQIAAAVAPLHGQEVLSRGPHSFEVEFIESSEGEAISTADDVVAHLTDVEGWRTGEIALLTTKHQHPVHKELIVDRERYWQSLWEKEDVFYGTVGGFKGLERPVVVLAVDGFHDNENIEDFLYVGMTRARDKLTVVAPPQIIQMLRG